MSITTSPGNPHLKQEDTLIVANTLAGAREIDLDTQGIPWAEGHRAGIMALYQTALQKDYPEEALGHNDAVRGMFERIPNHLHDYYLQHPDQLKAMYEDAKDDFTQNLLDNQSPELHSKIEDYKLMALDTFDRLYKLGLLPFFDEDKVIEMMGSMPQYFFSKFNIGSDGRAAAFYGPNGPNPHIGYYGARNLNPIVLLHEATHAFLEFGESNDSPFGRACNSLREATVQHIADRGEAISRLDGSDPKARSEVFSDRRAVAHFNNPNFIKKTKSAFIRPSRLFELDEKGIYEADRKIMYELCEGDITIADFVGALTEPTGDDLGTLMSKIDRQFGSLPKSKLYQNAFPHLHEGRIMEFIHEHIDGDFAENLCGGLEQRYERAEYVLNLIRDFKGKRIEAQGSRARQAARIAYAKLRKSKHQV